MLKRSISAVRKVYYRLHRFSRKAIRVKGMLKFLAAAKLIELSDEERAQLQTTSSEPNELVQDIAPVENVEPEPASMPDPAAFAQTDMSEGKSFEEIFKDAHLPESPYPAERLLRLLDGLRAMDATTRKAAVSAMDAADDNWKIEDSVLDAQRKIGTLEGYQKALDAQVTGNEQKTAAEIADLKLAEEGAVTEIRKQIAEMERLLEREVQKTAEHIATLGAGLQSARDAANRETKRIHAEIERLREIPAQFSHQ